MNTLLYSMSPLQITSSMEHYTTNLENKIRSSKVGIRSSPTEILTLGLTYDYMGNDLQQYKTTFAGLAKARITTSVLSSVVAFDPGKSGFTGQLAGCFGWGNMCATRYFMHAGGERKAKGNAQVRFGGGTIQIGYRFCLSNVMKIMPYVEGMVTTVNWDGYHEIQGPFPCKVGNREEKMLERSIGLRYDWTPSDSGQLTTWMALIVGKHTLSKLTARSLNIPLFPSESFPSKKRRYKQAEVGVCYELTYSNNNSINVSGNIHFKNGKQIEDRAIKFFLQHIF